MSADIVSLAVASHTADEIARTPPPLRQNPGKSVAGIAVRAFTLYSDAAWKAGVIADFARLGFPEPMTEREIQAVAISQARSERQALRNQHGPQS